MLVTRANPEQAAKLRALIAGESAPKRKAAAPKRDRKAQAAKRQLVSQYVAQLRGGGWLVQLPRYLPSQGVRSHWAAKAQTEYILNALRGLLRVMSENDAEREAIRGVTFVRISPKAGTLQEADDDNIGGAAFKYVRDATFAWIKYGNREFNKRAIGHADATIKTGKHTCLYEQKKCEANPRAHGIQILLHV